MNAQKVFKIHSVYRDLNRLIAIMELRTVNNECVTMLAHLNSDVDGRKQK